ncbi:uncharacterized protein LOC121428024, partial [Lytechinus variegatus]|uniref:uncharacterized protein LOC121428024 n=1 Tax=Lytechinus variegatus TaxID=7654 RepID=UPI001BB2B7CB
MPKVKAKKITTAGARKGDDTPKGRPGRPRGPRATSTPASVDLGLGGGNNGPGRSGELNPSQSQVVDVDEKSGRPRSKVSDKMAELDLDLVGREGQAPVGRSIAWHEIVAQESDTGSSGQAQPAVSVPARSAGVAEDLGLDLVEVGVERSEPQAPRLSAVLGAPEPFISACDPLGVEVAISLKEKIWASEYIDLGVLLKHNNARDEFGALSVGDTTLSLCQSGSGLGLQLQPQSKAKKIMSVEQWTSVFLVFASIYAEKHIERSRELMKYMDLIRHAARAFAGYGWRDYDTQFRSKQARLPGRSWASVDAELWLMLVASNG